MKIAVTGAGGFIGRHVVEALRRCSAVSHLYELRRDNYRVALPAALAEADAILHLAGVNRPEDPAEFGRVNRGTTQDICDELERIGRTPLVVLASSSQATQDNLYGRSKREAEEVLAEWAERCGASAISFRVKNVFGKWCRPNYNSVVATFCHNIAHRLPITVTDPSRILELVYIDDVVAAFIDALVHPARAGYEVRENGMVYAITLGELASQIRSFPSSRESLVLPVMDNDLTRRLYVTYLSYLDGADFSYPLRPRTDARGTLAEFLKSPGFGQIFISRTNRGITRGNHYHHSKTEKFLVMEGEAVVRFRQIWGAQVIEHRVSGREFKVVDIPPGYSHSIENIGEGELVTLFWSSEIFDPARPDTIMLPVLTPSTK